MIKEENQVDTPENNEEPVNENQPAEQETPAEDPAKLLQAKVDELNDKYIRLYSEFDNYRKRTIKEKSDLHKTAGEDIFKILLPVLDDFERAIGSMKEAKDINALKEGVELIYSKLKNSLQQKGLAPMESKGEAFDADIHEAITNVPAPTEDLKGKVVEEVEKGYSLNGKVIRYAKVIVGS